MTTVIGSCLILFAFRSPIPSDLSNMVFFRSLISSPSPDLSHSRVFSFILVYSVKAFIPSVFEASASFSASNKCSDLLYIYLQWEILLHFIFSSFFLTFPVLAALATILAMIAAFDLFSVVYLVHQLKIFYPGNQKITMAIFDDSERTGLIY